jgi:hypothetical protein
MEWRRFFLERKRFGQELSGTNVIALFEEWKKEKERDEIRFVMNICIYCFRESMRRGSNAERIGMVRSISGTSLGSAALESSTHSSRINRKTSGGTEVCLCT